MTPWQALGVAPDVAVSDLRRHYAALIKQFRPETHPQDFARIREAYEVVLSHARRREAVVAERAKAEDDAVAIAQVAHAEEVAAAADDPTPSVDDEPAAPAEVIGRPLVAEAAPERDTEPALAAHFRRFHAQAATAKGSDDDAHLPALRALLQARTQATLDDSQALEFALMRWFVEADAPPLTLLFETGRAFDWHRHAVRLSSWLSPWALRQMEARLALSRDLVYARHFSGNAWLRRLHAAGGQRMALACQAPLREAQRWAERWWRGCEDAGTSALAADLDAGTLANLRGHLLLSTDILVGLMAASAGPDLEGMAIYGVIGTALVFALRLATQAVHRLPEGHRLRAALATVLANVPLGVTLSVILGMLGVMVLGHEGNDLPLLLAGGLLVAPGALFTLWMLWRVAANVECYFTEGFAWRDAVDRLEFDRFLRDRPRMDGMAPFGTRASGWRRWRTIRAALRFETAEIAVRARPPLPTRFGRLSTARGQRSVPRLMWFAAWILFAILRVVHLIGSGH